MSSRDFDVPAWYGLEAVSCHLLPRLFERPWLVLVGVAGLCGFEPADDPVADLNNPSDQTIVGEPTVLFVFSVVWQINHTGLGAAFP